MDAQKIFYIALALMAVAGVVIFLLRKSKLNEVKVHHGLDSDSLKVAAQGITAVERVATKAFGSVNNLAGHAFPAVNNVADRAAEIAESSIAPLSKGVGDVLSAVAERIKGRQLELNKLNAQVVASAQEIERLKARQIDVTGMTAQLKLGLMQISQQKMSFQQTSLGETPERTFGTAERTEYLGLIRADYRIQIGLDIEKLRFQLTPDGKVLVEGLREIEILGLKDIDTEELIEEIRFFTAKGTFKGATAQILVDDARAKEKGKEQRKHLMRDIQSKESLIHLADTNAEFAMAFLQACLSAGGVKVEAAREPITESLRFSQLCQAINRIVANQIDELASKQISVEEKSRVLEAEILTLAMTPKGI